MKYAKGVMWLNDCRIPYVDEDKDKINFDRPRIREKNEEWILTGGFTFDKTDVKEYNTQGRFTPNLLVCDDVLNDGVIYKSGDGSGVMELININDAHHFSFDNPNRKITKMKGVQYNDQGSNSRYYDLDKWFSKMVDEIR